MSALVSFLMIDHTMPNVDSRQSVPRRTIKNSSSGVLIFAFTMQKKAFLTKRIISLKVSTGIALFQVSFEVNKNVARWAVALR